MHVAMDEEGMEKIKVLGQQHQMEWDDTTILFFKGEEAANKVAKEDNFEILKKFESVGEKWLKMQGEASKEEMEIMESSPMQKPNLVVEYELPMAAMASLMVMGS
ncbi:uncharacterized protein HKW66_Vig0122790 [Vigna angularis]|uniref:Uncharacterized protein n=1 Tax=Phaseolus angularis TaxID=3914 RepID=A0A8T0JY69_PHAAN|nr:uncharacterized protein HKW66_Vig0122790 [Vigna angularis]